MTLLIKTVPVEGEEHRRAENRKACEGACETAQLAPERRGGKLVMFAHQRKLTVPANVRNGSKADATLTAGLGGKQTFKTMRDLPDDHCHHEKA